MHKHFDKLGRVIKENSGAFVKTIGDAVMASFLNPLDAVKAALEMNREINRLSRAFTSRDLILKIGIHKGPCIAAPDYGDGRVPAGLKERVAVTGLRASAGAAAARQARMICAPAWIWRSPRSACTIRPHANVHGQDAALRDGPGALLCLGAFPARADNAVPPISFTTGARFGAFYGMANEYVYNQALSANYKNSELDWSLEPMIFTGAALSLDSTVGIFVTLDVRQGFAGKAGEMTDSDFLNGDGQRTHFSQSDSYAERANLLDLKVGWDFYRQGALRIGAFGAFSYMDFKWSARDGYLQYPTTGNPYTMSPFASGSLSSLVAQ